MSLENIAGVPRSWIEKQTGMEVVGANTQGRWRAHIYVELRGPSGERRTVLLRTSRDPDRKGINAIHARFTADHEARILAGLQGKGVKIPEFLGFYEEAQTILMGALNGQSAIHQLVDPDRQRMLMEEYFENMAQLHAVQPDVATFGPSVGAPATAEDIALDYFRLAQRQAFAPGVQRRPEPLIAAAVAWLERHIPKPVRGVSMVQADSGPAQFMFDEKGITGLVDWELAHAGDPMLDLGVVRLRNVLYPAGDLEPGFRRYEAVTGRPLDVDAVRYYTVLTILFALCAKVPAVHNLLEADSVALPALAWDARERVMLGEALLEAAGEGCPEIDLPVGGEGSDIHRLLLKRLIEKDLPNAPAGQKRSAWENCCMAEVLRREDVYGAERIAADLEDMENLLGRRPIDHVAGLAAIEKLVPAASDGELMAIVRLCTAMAIRQSLVVRPIYALDSWEDDGSETVPDIRFEPRWTPTPADLDRLLAPVVTPRG